MWCSWMSSSDWYPIWSHYMFIFEVTLKMVLFSLKMIQKESQIDIDMNRRKNHYRDILPCKRILHFFFLNEFSRMIFQGKKTSWSNSKFGFWKGRHNRICLKFGEYVWTQARFLKVKFRVSSHNLRLQFWSKRTYCSTFSLSRPTMPVKSMFILMKLDRL